MDKDVIQDHLDKKSVTDSEKQGLVFMTSRIIIGLMNTKYKLTEDEVIAHKSHPFHTEIEQHLVTQGCIVFARSCVTCITRIGTSKHLGGLVKFEVYQSSYLVKIHTKLCPCLGSKKKGS